jgi:hypothetical protein
MSLHIVSPVSFIVRTRSIIPLSCYVFALLSFDACVIVWQVEVPLEREHTHGDGNGDSQPLKKVCSSSISDFPYLHPI